MTSTQRRLKAAARPSPPPKLARERRAQRPRLADVQAALEREVRRGESLRFALDNALGTLRDLELKLNRATRALDMVRQWLGHDFVALEPHLYDPEQLGLDRVPEVLDLHVRTVRCHRLHVSAQLDAMTAALHFKVRIGQEDAAFFISETAMLETPEAFLRRHLANELAGQLVARARIRKGRWAA